MGHLMTWDNWRCFMGQLETSLSFNCWKCPSGHFLLVHWRCLVGPLKKSHGTVGDVSWDSRRRVLYPCETYHWRLLSGSPETACWTIGDVLLEMRDASLDNWKHTVWLDHQRHLTGSLETLDCFNSITVRLVISTSTMGMWKVVKLVFHCLGGGVGKGRLCWRFWRTDEYLEVNCGSWARTEDEI